MSEDDFDDFDGPRWPAHNGFRSTDAENAELLKYIVKMQKAGAIRRSTSELSAPVVFVPVNGEQKICFDYRLLNAITVRIKTPLPRISTMLEKLRGAKWYTKLDLQTAYMQTNLTGKTITNAAFTCKFGKFEPLTTPFGLCNALEMFQKIMFHVLGKEMAQGFCLAYYEGLVVYSSGSQEDHGLKVERVLTVLKNEHFFCKKDLCSFFEPKLHLLGYTISELGIKASADRVRVARDWPLPFNRLGLCGFVNLVAYFCTHIEKYDHYSTPIYELAKATHDGCEPIVWTEETKTAFMMMKKAFVEAPMLRYITPRGQRRITVWASRRAIGATIKQQQGLLFLTVNHYSKPLKPHECNWPAATLEKFAIAEATKFWKKYIDDSPADEPCLIDFDPSMLE